MTPHIEIYRSSSHILKFLDPAFVCCNCHSARSGATNASVPCGPTTYSKFFKDRRPYDIVFCP